MYDVGFETAVDNLALDDIAWLGLLAKDGDCVVGCDEGVEGVDLAVLVMPGSGPVWRISHSFPRTSSSMCLFAKVLNFHTSISRCPH